MKRAYISLKTKLAAALLALGDIPYDDAKGMGEDHLISLYHFDHGVLHGIEVCDEYWNLTPRLIQAHRSKSRKDAGIVAKSRRLEAKWKAFQSKMAAKETGGQVLGYVQKRAWPKRKMGRRKPGR